MKKGLSVLFIIFGLFAVAALGSTVYEFFNPHTNGEVALIAFFLVLVLAVIVAMVFLVVPILFPKQYSSFEEYIQSKLIRFRIKKN